MGLLGGHSLGFKVLNIGSALCYMSVGLMHLWRAGGASMSVPGADLLGVCTARDLVFWLNGHPELQGQEERLGTGTSRQAVVIGWVLDLNASYLQRQHAAVFLFVCSMDSMHVC